jgi:hypothetical protein
MSSTLQSVYFCTEQAEDWQWRIPRERENPAVTERLMKGYIVFVSSRMATGFLTASRCVPEAFQSRGTWHSDSEPFARVLNVRNFIRQLP